ncbi:MAG: S8 family serine peptidase, partial [Cyanobacteria bacterium REEB65]|nr:S8 family serine peptidase [Cyanobacteria bacterium REEB65]
MRSRTGLATMLVFVLSACSAAKGVLATSASNESPDGAVAGLLGPSLTVSGSGSQMAIRSLGLSAPATPPNADLGIVVQLKAGAAPVFGVQSLESIASMPLRKIMAGTYAVQAKSTAERDQLIAQLQADPNVAYAGPDRRYTITSAPNDPYYSQQWALPQISAPQAWNSSTGAKILIADVDTGVDYTHPDLAGQVIEGYNFVANTADPMDDNGHGTFVAGILAAATNNGIGVAGTAYGAKVLAIKALDSSGSGTDTTLAPAILYAANHGANVISCSWGSTQDDPIIDQAIDEAVASGCIVVAAAGNNGNTTPFYPAAHAGVLSVGATDTSDARASFSNYGPWVMTAAPGTGIISTYPGNQYAQGDGTSFATPYVSGVLAMIESLHPAWSPSTAKQQLLTTGDPTTGFGNSNCLRINAYRALGGTTAAPTPTPSSTPTPSPTPTPSNGVTIRGVGTSGITQTGATITWTTSQAAGCEVDFGTSRAYGWKTLEFSPASSHWTALSGLQSGTTYYYQIQVQGSGGSG